MHLANWIADLGRRTVTGTARPAVRAMGAGALAGVLAGVLAAAGPAAAQERGGQGGAAPDLARCGEMPSGADSHDCACPADFALGNIWGSGPLYTADSDICTAALHSGVIGRQGGLLSVARAPGQPGYAGSDRNGVVSRDWGAFDSSIKMTGYAVGGDTSVFDMGACAPLPADLQEAICACEPGANSGGSIWGSNPYTADSDICIAAIHAGVIGAEGGTLVLRRRPGQSDYPGSTAHGITSSDWGSYDESIYLAAVARGGKETGARLSMADTPACGALPEDGLPAACACAPDLAAGPVWGSGPYTGDSDICTAARHSGAIGAGGGLIEVTRLPGQSDYPGSTENGVQTEPWGSYEVSFDVAPLGTGGGGGNAGATGKTVEAGGADAVAGGACTVMPEGVDILECSCGRSPARGDVWGVGPYTSDSDICTAARHAGVIRAFGGDVRVLRIRGLGAYAGGAGNGITTQEWNEAYDSSITFDMN